MSVPRPAERTLRVQAATPGDLSELLAVPDTELLAAPDTGLLAGPDVHLLAGADVGAGSGCRLGIVSPNEKRLALARKVVARGRPWRGRNDVWFSPAPLLDGAARLAFVFPGLEAEFAPRIDDVADWVGAAPPPLSDVSLGQHAASVLAVGRLLDTALRRLAIRPAATAGHSIGEWAAMLAGGIVSEEAFDALIGRRDLDDLQVPGVEFAVLGCGLAAAAAAIEGRPGVVVSHENSTNQTVVCGPSAELVPIMDELRARGVICQILPFRSGFHTPMLDPYLGPFRDRLLHLDVHPATLPVWSATTAEPFPPDPDAIARLSVRHLLEPVRFRAVVEAMHAAGVRVFVQVGAGQLASLIDDTLRDVDHMTIAANSADRGGLDQLLRVAVAVWAEGGAPDFAALAGEPRSRDQPPAAPPMPDDPWSRLRDLGAQLPVAAEFEALLSEMTDSVAAVLDAAVPAEDTLHVSTSAMPYLLDHCLAAQREGWPDESDRRPVVPAATTIWHLMRAAERTVPGRTAVGLDDVRLHRWLVAAPPQDMAVRTRRIGTHRVHVTIGDVAEGDVLLGDNEPAPALWPPEPGARAGTLSATDLYEQRWMFHGPAFRTVTACRAVGERSVRAELTVPDAPGALLDGVGQVLGVWLIEREESWIAFPVRIARIRYHGADPQPGARLECAVWITAVTADAVEAQAQLTIGGRPWVSISGWHDRRFDGGGRLGDIHRFPQVSTLSECQAGGWWLLTDPWRGGAARELARAKYLAADERAEYEACPVRERRRWLLRRVVVKDAVRGWMWAHGAGPLFPAEIAVADTDGGRCTVGGRHGLGVPDLDVVVAHHGEAAVALVAEPGHGANIRIEEAREGSGWAPGPFTSVVGNPEGLPTRQYVVTWTGGRKAEPVAPVGSEEITP